MRLTRIVICLALMLVVRRPVWLYAQDAQPQTIHRAIEITGLVGANYPIAVSGGFGVLVGSERDLGGRYGYRRLKGISASAEAGPGGIVGRLGWTNLFRYDAGADGFSFEAVYLRPWGLRWGVEHKRNWVGPGLTYRMGYARIAGAALIRIGATSFRVAPSATVGLVFPLN